MFRSPRASFPLQDTGAIQGITTAAQDTSFAEMARRQQALADAILKDPDVTNLSSFIGVDGVNSALNSGRMLITLKPRDERNQTAVEIIRRLYDETKNVSGISIAMQPVQDLTIDSTVGKAQYLFFLENPNQSTLAAWTPRLVERMRQTPVFENVSSDLELKGRQLHADDRPRHRRPLRHHDRDRRQRALRRVRPAHRLDLFSPRPTSTG